LGIFIRLKLKAHDVSKNDFVSVFRWKEMRNSLHWCALQNKPVILTASEYVLPTPLPFEDRDNFVLRNLVGFLTSDEQQPQH
jgi:hypothetical protein